MVTGCSTLVGEAPLGLVCALTRPTTVTAATTPPARTLPMVIRSDVPTRKTLSLTRRYCNSQPAGRPPPRRRLAVILRTPTKPPTPSIAMYAAHASAIATRHPDGTI